MAGLAAGAGQTSARPDLVAKVAAGELKEARASWWGFEAAVSPTLPRVAFGGRAEIADKCPGASVPLATLLVRGDGRWLLHAPAVGECGVKLCAEF